MSAAIHLAALAALLLWHFAPNALLAPAALTVVDLPDKQVPDEPKPPPPPPPPKQDQDAARSRAAGAPAPTAVAAPLAAAIPIALPSFVPAPIPAMGNAPASGAASAGVGTGAGGTGNGAGGGGDGNGTGSGGRGEGTGPEVVRGGFKHSDYPKALREAGPSGTTSAEVIVGTNGRPISCRIEQSSGTPLLDSETCRILMQRHRFRPARDPSGKPVQAPYGFDVQWEYLDPPEK